MRAATNELEGFVYLDFEPSARQATQAGRNLSSPLARLARQQRRDQNGPSEFRAALRYGIENLAALIGAARKRVKDMETALHLQDLTYQLAR